MFDKEYSINISMRIDYAPKTTKKWFRDNFTAAVENQKSYSITS